MMLLLPGEMLVLLPRFCLPEAEPQVSSEQEVKFSFYPLGSKQALLEAGRPA